MSRTPLVLRSSRGAAAVADALGIDCAVDAASVVAACRRLVPEVALRFHREPSRARPRARGRYLAGEVTLFPRAFADPVTLAHTLLHELAHARGEDEAGAERFATEVLRGPRRSPWGSR